MIRSSFLVFVFSTILFNCQNVKYVYEDKGYLLTSLEQQFDFKDKTISIFFENGFINDNSKIFIDGNLIYDKVITTDYTIGVAGFLLYDKKFENISIFINETKIDIVQSNIKDYKNIYVNQTKDKQQVITFSNKPHLYR